MERATRTRRRRTRRVRNETWRDPPGTRSGRSYAIGPCAPDGDVHPPRTQPGRSSERRALVQNVLTGQGIPDEARLRRDAAALGVLPRQEEALREWGNQATSP